MAGLDWVIPALILIYLAECSVWLTHYSVLFRVWPGGKVTAGHPLEFLGNEKKGLAAGFPVPPFGRLMPAAHLPFVLSPEGVALLPPLTPAGIRPQRDPAPFIHWSDLQDVVQNGRNLSLNGFPPVDCLNEAEATRWLLLFNTLKSLPSPARERRILEEIRFRFDTDRGKQQIKAADLAAAGVNRITGSVWIFLFVLLPALILVFGFAETAIFWFSGGLLLHLIQVVTVWKKEKPGQGIPSRWIKAGRFLHLLISPFYTLRSGDRISARALEGLHPAAAAQILLAGEARDRVVGAMIRDLTWPVSVSGQPEEIKSAIRWMNDQLLSRIRQLGNFPQPEMSGAGAYYCPRCLTVYRSDRKTCSDCPEIPLKPAGGAD